MKTITRRFETDHLLGIITGHPIDRYDVTVWLLKHNNRRQVLDNLSPLKFPVQIEEFAGQLSVSGYCLTYQQAEQFLHWVNQAGEGNEDWPQTLDIPSD